jgi:hypothetical protein
MPRRSVAIRVAAAVAVLATTILLLWSVAGRPDRSCNLLLQKRPSPNGAWIAEDYRDICADQGAIRLSLRPAQEAPARRSAFFLSAPDDSWAENLVLKWLGNSELAIAIPAANRLPDWAADFQPPPRQRQFRGATIDYTVYPNDPDAARDPSSWKIVRMPITFADSFVFTPHAVGVPGAMCNLYLRSADSAYYDQLSIRINLQRTDSVRALDASGKTVNVPAQMDMSILVYGGQATSVSIGDVTAAAFDALPRRDNRDLLDRNFIPITAPSGKLAPAWQIGWHLDRPSLDAILRKIVSGAFTVKLGFWLENREVVYSNDAALALDAIADFKRCVVDQTRFMPTP